MTRKEFVLQTVEKIKENPRAILAGHGISNAVLQELVGREDAMSKLAVVLYSTKYATKGAIGLKKSNNFAIKGYRNFGEFTANARQDIEDFIGALTPEDSATFKNSENIYGIMLLPAKNIDSAANTTTEDAIITGKSVPMSFDQTIRKEYGIAGAMYVLAMFGDSAIRPAEMKLAEKKATVNKRKNIKRTPAVIKKELQMKANKKLNVLANKRKDLQSTANILKSELGQYASVASQFGMEKAGNPMMVKSAMNKFDANSANVQGIIASLDGEQKTLFANAVKYMKKGKTNMARAFLKELANSTLSAYVLKGEGASTTNDVLKSRKNEIKKQISALTIRNEQLLVDLALAPDVKAKNSVKSSISRNNSTIKSLRMKLGTYKDMSPKALMNKAAMLKQVNAMIEENIAAGESIQTALSEAINALDATPAQKQVIKQEVIDGVVSGTPMQFAVQQAIQNNIQETPAIDDTTFLNGGNAIEDILNNL